MKTEYDKHHLFLERIEKFNRKNKNYSTHIPFWSQYSLLLKQKRTGDIILKLSLDNDYDNEEYDKHYEIIRVLFYEKKLSVKETKLIKMLEKALKIKVTIKYN